ncbi:hypothetical protein DPMN_177128 [Dreissena polymorpha]|uniref:Uncharacterized protein n=1 Tax=Dreissena polymorpha TaxID=45954 RepID=A0A9D4EAH4_DREPO|nr:hypothetical protein DPMN_177128 [Dreissena polymorpha]
MTLTINLILIFRRRRFSRTLEVSSKSADRKFFTKEATLESVRETEKETDLLLESNSLNSEYCFVSMATE